MNKLQNKKIVLWIYPALAVITLAVFFQVRNFDFINYDDNKYVSENRHILTGLSRENIVWLFTKDIGRWHPLAGLTHMLDCQLFGAEPGWHHLTNLLLHIINTLLLFAVFKRATGTVWQSAFVAGLFAIHPLHVESVAWISGRKDLLSTLFWILTIAAYFHYAENRSSGWYVIALALFILGLMAKPMLITLPFVLLLLDYWPLQRFQPRIFFRLVWEKIPFFAIAVVAIISTFFIQRSIGGIKPIGTFPLNVRVSNAVISYGGYILKMIWPARLTVFYPYSLTALQAWRVAAVSFLLLFITIYAVRFGKNRKYLLVGWFWYLGTLVPVIGLVQLGEHAMADRYTYVPLIGLFVIIAYGVNDLLANQKNRKIILGLSAFVVISVFAICAAIQTGYWHNSKTLFEYALAVNENNYVAHYCLGDWWFQQGKIEDAVTHFNEALRINPNYLLAQTGLGVALARQGKFDEAIKWFRSVIKYDSESGQTYYNLGVALAAQGKYDEALRQYRAALDLNPSYVMVYNNIGAILFFQGKLDDAVNYYEKALELEPDYADAHNNLGAALLAQGKLDEAVGHFRRALQLKPDAANIHCNLGYALARQGKPEEGMTYISEALRLNPNFPEAHYYLASLLAQKDRIDEAIKHTEQALKLAQAGGNKQLISQIQKSLDSYKSRQK